MPHLHACWILTTKSVANTNFQNSKQNVVDYFATSLGQVPHLLISPFHPITLLCLPNPFQASPSQPAPVMPLLAPPTLCQTRDSTHNNSSALSQAGAPRQISHRMPSLNVGDSGEFAAMEVASEGSGINLNSLSSISAGIQALVLLLEHNQQGQGSLAAQVNTKIIMPC